MPEALKLRATLLERIRAYFARHAVMEVDTPALSAAAATDPAIHSLSTVRHGPGTADGSRCYLHTSPEFPMKRLLAAGSGDIYQVCKVFRDHERGAWHSPEFTLLEWYRTGFDHLDLMDDVEQLLTGILADIAPVKSVDHWTYRDLFREFAGIDPFAADAATPRPASASASAAASIRLQRMPRHSQMHLPDGVSRCRPACRTPRWTPGLTCA